MVANQWGGGKCDLGMQANGLWMHKWQAPASTDGLDWVYARGISSTRVLQSVDPRLTSLIPV
jgi:hypothetical protein